MTVWQIPMPKPAWMAANCAPSLSTRRAKLTGRSRQVPHRRADEAGLRIEANQVVVDQIGQRDRHPAPVKVIATGMKAQADIADMPGDQRLLPWLEHPHRDIGLPLQQVVGLVGQRQFDRQRGVRPAQSDQDRRQVHDADCLAGADPHDARNRIRLTAARAPQRLRRADEHIGMGA